jgi:hypothetical protein
MKTFSVQGRCDAAPPPADWHEQLARMLGAKPRRIGGWAELGLYGALRCLQDAGETNLPQDAQIWLGSRVGTRSATNAVLDQMHDDLPMPLAFLQTQPSQLLALLAAQTRWTGHACFVAGGDALSLLRLAAVQAGGGLLLGWLDETEGGESRWLRLKPDNASNEGFIAAPVQTLFAERITHVRLTGKAMEVRREG